MIGSKSKDSDQTVQMCRLVRSFSVCLCVNPIALIYRVLAILSAIGLSNLFVCLGIYTCIELS